MHIKENFKISVIIPVFNTQDYLKICLDSVLQQTYHNLEIILIDDGSSDKSGEICDAYANQYSNVLVRHIKNEGVSSARNLGISLATGDFIGFIDSDDIIASDMYENLLKLVQTSNAQIACCGFTKFSDDQKLPQESVETIEIFTSEQALTSLLTENKLETSTCNKLFSVSLLTDVRFFSKGMYEDLTFNVMVALKATKVVYSTKLGYYYRYRATGATNRPYDGREKALLEYMNIIQTSVSERYPQLISSCDFCRAQNCLFILLKMAKEKKQYKMFRQDYDMYNSILRSNKKLIFKSSSLTTSYKLRALATMLNIYAPLYTVFKKKKNTW